jgi:hypothetical protein
MRIALLLIGIFFTASAHCADNARPQGKNCNLSTPPATAGEETNHGVILRIFPRAKDITASYTGCQVLMAPNNQGWTVISLTEIIQGDPIRVWSDYAQDESTHTCRYRKGKVVRGDANNCPSPQYILMQSLPAGCVRILQDAMAQQGSATTMPPQCEYE